METRIATCKECGETDYLDFTALFDGKRYCQACWNDNWAQNERDILKARYQL